MRVTWGSHHCRARFLVYSWYCGAPQTKMLAMTWPLKTIVDLGKVSCKS